MRKELIGAKFSRKTLEHLYEVSTTLPSISGDLHRIAVGSSAPEIASELVAACSDLNSGLMSCLGSLSEALAATVQRLDRVTEHHRQTFADGQRPYEIESLVRTLVDIQQRLTMLRNTIAVIDLTE
jgi:hypothetical protein